MLRSNSYITKQLIKKILYISFICSMTFGQTGIITSDGFRGYGLWAKINKPFSKEKQDKYNFTFEFYSSVGIEVAVSTEKEELTAPWNSIGAGYHYKVRNLGLKIFYSKNLYDTYDFNQKTNSFDIYSMTLYRTGKLNPFFAIEKRSGYGDSIGDVEGNLNTSIDFLSLGGLGRITRFLTLSGSIKIPMINSFNINNAIIETSLGFVY